MFELNFTILAIGSAVFAAIANILARTLLKNLRSQDILGINFLTMGATLVLVSPSFYYFDATPFAMALLLSIGLIDTLANYFYFKTFEKTEASVATPILSLAPVFTFILGWFVINDVVSWKTLLIALLITSLIIIFSVDFKNIKTFKKNTFIPAITASLLFGISAIPSKMLLDTLDVINSPTLYMFRSGVIALFALLFFGFKVHDLSLGQYRIIFVRGLFVIAQWLLLYYALSLGNAGVTITLANITPVFVFILGALFLKERMTWKKGFAAILILALSSII